MGHMEMVEKEATRSYYIPHHAVIKPESLTTKTRVVFDASAKTTTGRSLNDCMYIGAKQQRDLFEILMTWRKYAVVFKADIAKMYRKIKIHQEDKQYQTILWRDDPKEEIKEFQLSTVTFGTAAAPFLATRVLKQLAEESAIEYPEAAKRLLEDFYVDDLISGCDTIAEAEQIQKELITSLAKGGFQLRKWSSNKQEVLNQLPAELTEKSLQVFKDSDTTTALGLQWSPRQDKFKFRVSWNIETRTITKRRLLSEASKLFDPMGWLAPMIVTAKLMMQQVWLSKIGWDEEVPPDIAEKWTQFREELPLVEQIEVERWIHHHQEAQVELHGFCDASEKGYAAVIYTRITMGEEVKITLVASKTRVAPVNMKATLPRLELCGAVLLANLMRTTKESLQIESVTTTAWCDSMITLGWLKGEPSKWKTFVANRVADIQSNRVDNWRYIRSDDNPADCASRGIMPQEMKDHSLWWKGPTWLNKNPEEWPTIEAIVEAEDEKKVVVNVATISRRHIVMV